MTVERPVRRSVLTRRAQPLPCSRLGRRTPVGSSLSWSPEDDHNPSRADALPLKPLVNRPIGLTARRSSSSETRRPSPVARRPSPVARRRVSRWTIRMASVIVMGSRRVETLHAVESTGARRPHRGRSGGVVGRIALPGTTRTTLGAAAENPPLPGLITSSSHPYPVVRRRLESGRPQGPQVRILSVPLMGSRWISM